MIILKGLTRLITRGLGAIATPAETEILKGRSWLDLDLQGGSLIRTSLESPSELSLSLEGVSTVTTSLEGESILDLGDDGGSTIKVEST